MNKKTESTELSKHEWTAIFIILSFLLFLTFINLYNHKNEMEDPLLVSSNHIAITLTGEVENPGTFEFPKGVTLQKVLENHPLLPEAHKNKLNLKSKVYDNTTINIEKEPRIWVTLKQGKNDSIEIEVPEGCTLKKLFQDRNITPSQFKKDYGKVTRKLNDREIIELTPKETKN